MRILILIIVTLFLTGCKSCSKSGRKQLRSESKEYVDESNRETTTSKEKRSRSVSGSTSGGKNIIKMQKIGGVYQIPIKINGVELYFIFDTGASTISISMAEATVLYKQGKLTKSDIIGTEKYKIADGSIQEGTTIILRKVVIGNKTITNVKASVAHNLEAPLLLGQSALESFGKISIDNERKEIIFE